ncbi:Hypothetical_protein [Hexamita inflata]|uniref:Hypothetical_protein n=1 Tax=Hexamita inflata TaxID=28002 RepID=A0ABP1JHR9_9EUKA
MNTEIIQQSTITSVVNNDNNFAVFGFNQQIQQIISSVINITISFKTNTAALICFQCDISVHTSVLVFMASGQILSGLIFQSVQTVQVHDTSIQYRFYSVYSAALIYNVSQIITTFTLINTHILGFSALNNFHSIISLSSFQVFINNSNTTICDSYLNISERSFDLIFSSQLQFSCSQCVDSFLIYGVCADSLRNSCYFDQNKSFVCTDSFEFNGYECVCSQGYVINGTQCVNLVSQLSQLYLIYNLQNVTISQIQIEIENMKSDINQQNEYLYNNMSQMKLEMLQNMITIENSIVSNKSLVIQELTNTVNILDGHIANNASMLLSLLVANSSNLEQQIIVNVQSLSQQIADQSILFNTFISSVNGKLVSLDQNCSKNISNLNSTAYLLYDISQNNLQYNTSILDKRIADNITLKDMQIEQLTYQLTQLQNIIMNTKEQEMWFKCESRLYTFQIYDTPHVTNTVKSTDFPSGFAFTSQTVLNALIDVQSTSSNFTLFQNQVTLLNIKIQLGNITFGTGALVSQNQQLCIQQMSIISVQKQYLQINSGVIFSILQPTATSTNITNLLLNLTFDSVSAGLSNLINVVNGNLNINGYKILGTHISTDSMSLGANLVLDNSTVQLQYIIIQLLQFTCGNSSSYLLSIVNQSIVMVQHISVLIGNNSYYNVFSYISSNSTNQMQFGGVICSQTNVIATITDLTFQIFEQWTSFVGSSGQILGSAFNSQNSIQSVCSLEYVTSSSIFCTFGLVGQYHGSLNINCMLSNIQITSGDFDQTGTIVYVDGQQCTIKSVQVCIQMPNNTGNQAGVLACSLMSWTQLITNVTIKDSHITSKILSGFITSYMTQCSFKQINIQSSTAISNSTSQYSLSGALSGDTVVGAAFEINMNQIYLYNITIITQSTGMWAISGGLIGDSHNTLTNMQKIKIDFSQICSNGPVSGSVQSTGLIVTIYNTDSYISDVYVMNTNISSSSSTKASYCAGFIAASDTKVQIFNSKVRSIQINISSPANNVGILLTNPVPIFTANNVSSEGINTINGNTILNCGNITNIAAQNGC